MYPKSSKGDLENLCYKLTLLLIPPFQNLQNSTIAQSEIKLWVYVLLNFKFDISSNIFLILKWTYNVTGYRYMGIQVTENEFKFL